MPLLGYTLVPPTLVPFYTPTPRGTADYNPTLTPLALYLTVTGPVCYETPVGSLMCLGQVTNPLDVPVEQINIRVHLLSHDGTLLIAGNTLVARAVLPVGQGGPYRVLFDSVPSGYEHAVAFVESMQIAQNTARRYAELALRQVSGTFVINQYQIAISVINTGSIAVDHVAVTMTLLDWEQQVTGFRQVYLDPDQRLEPGESIALTIKVIPQGPGTIGFDAFAEGRPVLD